MIEESKIERYLRASLGTLRLSSVTKIGDKKTRAIVVQRTKVIHLELWLRVAS